MGHTAGVCLPGPGPMPSQGLSVAAPWWPVSMKLLHLLKARKECLQDSQPTPTPASLLYAMPMKSSERNHLLSSASALHPFRLCDSCFQTSSRDGASALIVLLRTWSWGHQHPRALKGDGGKELKGGSLCRSLSSLPLHPTQQSLCALHKSL